MNNSTSLQHQEHEDQEEDALSLCDFPLNSGELEKTHHGRQTSSQPSDSFEFSNDRSIDILSHAEDIIHCGKLMPYKEQQQQQRSFLGDHTSEKYDSTKFSRRYCESLPARSNSYGGNTRLTLSSRSLDLKKLRRNSSLVMKSEASDIHRSFSKSKSEASNAGWKPKWYDLTFGLAKCPPEMDLRDMKNRQIRRNPGSMFVAADGGDGRSDRRSSSWGHDLLRVLSCKNNPGSVAVTASIGLVPQL